jgi:hypothetical protein
MKRGVIISNSARRNNVWCAVAFCLFVVVVACLLSLLLVVGTFYFFRSSSILCFAPIYYIPPRCLSFPCHVRGDTPIWLLLPVRVCIYICLYIKVSEMKVSNVHQCLCLFSFWSPTARVFNVLCSIFFHFREKISKSLITHSQSLEQGQECTLTRMNKLVNFHQVKKKHSQGRTDGDARKKKTIDRQSTYKQTNSPSIYLLPSPTTPPPTSSSPCRPSKAPTPTHRAKDM